MTIEQIRRMYEKRPFKPFSVHLADGREIHVPHPELLAFSPSGRTVSIGLPDDSFEIIDLLLVTSIHAGNGARPKPRR